MVQLFQNNNTLSEQHIKADRLADQKVPDGMIKRCLKCQTEFFNTQVNHFNECPNCGYGFRITAKKRLAWLVDESEQWQAELGVTDPLKFPNYAEKVQKAQKLTGLNESVWTGKARINQTEFALGIMDPYFIMGSLGQQTGEKITHLFEQATDLNLPVVLFTASGGARMQEGIMSLMQMAKITNAIKRHSEAGLLYLVVLCDPTTGGVTASFASLGDITLAEPHALVGFAGRRVIEQTIHQQLPADAQDAEQVLQHGFIDAIVKRSEEKQRIEWLLKVGAGNAKSN